MGLLKGLPPLLSADLLHVLRSMGHGDVLCVADANFPAAEVLASTGRDARYKREKRCEICVCRVLQLPRAWRPTENMAACQHGVQAATLP